MRATIGISRRSSDANSSASAPESARFSSRLKSAIERIHPRSAPAQNVSPSLASTTQRASAGTPSTAFVSWAMTSASNAFFRSGRAIVIRATRRSSIALRTTSAIGR